MNPVATAAPDLATILDAQTVAGALYERLTEGKLRCVACGHRCIIFPGHRGICQVRFNDGGTLHVPWGYVAALQCDPTEKKPFYHVLPGSKTLTFGMLGCDYHCPNCFTPETRVVTDRGVLPIGDLFMLGGYVLGTLTGDVTHSRDLQAITSSGQARPVVQLFKHRYVGNLVVIRPYYLPALRCTPDHRVFATADPAQHPQELEARLLTARHYLAVPRRYHFSSPQAVDVRKELAAHRSEFGTPHKMSAKTVEHIMMASAAGMTSRALGFELGKDVAKLIVDGRTVRFSKEHRPGIPMRIRVDGNFARLLGYYCAEGSIHKSSGRPNSFGLTFAFGPREADLADETRRLIASVLGLQATVRTRPTSLIVTVEKASAALLFRSLCGTGAIAKRVPQVLFDAPHPVVEAFLDAYVRGDGFRYRNGKVTVTTKSAALAYGAAWLSLKTGRLPSLYESHVKAERLIIGRRVKQSPREFTVVWYDNPRIRRKAIVTEDFHLVPIRSLGVAEYSGDVFNMEVEKEHNYLANFALVANCQNWLTSQALRDPAAGIVPETISPRDLVRAGLRHDAQLVASSYNEPLITAEWAVAVFKEARDAGLRTCFVSNGNATSEALRFLRPWCDCYKIDLKTMSQKNYRYLGGVLQRVLDTIRVVHAMGFWMEIVTLVIPGWNDSDEELSAAAAFIAAISKDIPWHVTAFHSDYKMTVYGDTPAATLVRAAQIGEAAGLRYVYAGNLPGQVGRYEHTYCPGCRAVLVERRGFRVVRNRLAATQGSCPQCGEQIPGIWS